MWNIISTEIVHNGEHYLKYKNQCVETNK